MVAADQIYFWAWDARPFPGFPYLDEVWSDSENYDKGHWLSGRLGAAPLSRLVAQILNDYGFADHQTQTIEGIVDGYLIDRTMSARQALEPLSSAFSFDGLESEGLLKFRHRDENPVISLSLDNLVESKADKPVITLKRAQETELPNRMQILFIDGQENYRQSVVEARKLTGLSQRDSVQEVPVVLAHNSAQSRVEIALHETWTGRETANFSLSPDMARLEAGDIIDLQLSSGQNRLLRIEELSDGNGLSISARQTAKQDYQPSDKTTRTGLFETPPVFGQPLFEILSLPLLNSSANPYAPWIAARAAPWPGNMLVVESADSGFTEIATLPAPAIIGETLTDFPAGPLSRIDYANTLTVQLASGELSSVSRLELLAGANVLAVGDQTSGWEIIQFQDAELVDTNTYVLKTLLRGQAGSDPEMMSLRSGGSRCVLLNASVLQLPATSSDLDRLRLMRIGPGHLDHADEAFVEFTHVATAIGLRPLNPVHLNARHVATGLQLAWVRRTRIDGDSWALLDVPLAEESEQYSVEIMDGATVVRTFTVSEPSVTYSDEDRLADFGSPLPSQLTFRVAQISATYGPGTYKENTLNV